MGKASTPFAKWVSYYAELAAGEVFKLDSKINAVENQKEIVTRVGSLCLMDYENWSSGVSPIQLFDIASSKCDCRIPVGLLWYLIHRNV